MYLLKSVVQWYHVRTQCICMVRVTLAISCDVRIVHEATGHVMQLYSYTSDITPGLYNVGGWGRWPGQLSGTNSPALQ